MKTKLILLATLLLSARAFSQTVVVDGNALGKLSAGTDFSVDTTSGNPVFNLSTANTTKLTLANTALQGVTVTVASGSPLAVTSSTTSGVVTVALTVPTGRPVMTNNNTSTVAFNSAGNDETVYNTSGSLLSTCTITLPTTTVVGQTLTYAAKSAITTLTVSGGTLDVGTNPSLGLGTGGVIVYRATTTTGHFLRLQ